jgi:hypothetical protein
MVSVTGVTDTVRKMSFGAGTPNQKRLGIITNTNNPNAHASKPNLYFPVIFILFQFLFVVFPTGRRGRIQSGVMEERALLFFFAENITTVLDLDFVIFVGCDGDVFRGECHFAI